MHHRALRTSERSSNPLAKWKEITPNGVELAMLVYEKETFGSNVARRARNEEFNEMHGFACWQVCENDHGGFKKLMWHGMMKEFSCKATSTLSKCA